VGPFVSKEVMLEKWGEQEKKPAEKEKE